MAFHFVLYFIVIIVNYWKWVIGTQHLNNIAWKTLIASAFIWKRGAHKLRELLQANLNLLCFYFQAI